MSSKMILIRNNFKPFSLLPGTQYCILGTFWKVKIFPCYLEFIHLIENSRITLKFYLEGRIEKFASFLDLERERIEVSGISKKGFFKYFIYKSGSSVVFYLKKADFFFEGTIDENNDHFPLKEEKVLFHDFQQLNKEKERLFMGISKKQDVDFIHRRKDLKELLPFWFYLGQFYPKMPEIAEGTAGLFLQLEEKILKKEKEFLEKMFLDAYLASFSTFFVPRLNDHDYWGILKNKEEVQGNPFFILQKGYEIIRKMLFIQKNHRFYFLPYLPPFCFSGRMIHIQCKDYGVLDFEWSKKKMRRAVFYAKKDFEMILIIPHIKRFRIKRSLKEKGRIHDSLEKILIEKGRQYYFDRFEK